MAGVSPPPLDLVRACVLVDDALYRRNLGQAMDPTSLRRYVAYQSMAVQWAIRVAVCVNILLVMVEEPAVWEIPHVWPNLAELATIVVFTCQLGWIASFVKVERRLSTDPKHVGLAIVLVATVVDMLGSLLYGFRVTRVLRVYFISYNSKFIRSAIRDIRKTIPSVVDVIVLLFFFITVYAVFCTVLFLPLQDDPGHFSSIWAGFTSMYVLRTTANFPDVMMPFYSQNRLAAVVFMVFLCVATYLLTSLVLAVIYNKYRNHMKQEEAQALRMQRKALAEAFRLLDTTASSTLDIETWTAMMGLLRPSWSFAKVHLLFRVLTHDAAEMHRHQFFEIVHLLNITIETEAVRQSTLWLASVNGTSSSSMFDALRVTLLSPSAANESRVRRASSMRADESGRTMAVEGAGVRESPAMMRFRAVVQSRLFAYLVDLAIVINVVLVAIEIDKERETDLPTDQQYSEIVFTLLFTLEALCKVTALGMQHYFDDGWNRFDFLLVALTLFDIVASYAFESVFSGVFRYLLLLRVIRLWSTLGEIKRYRVLISTLWQLLPALATYAAIQFMVFFVFAIVGMEVFGGLIYEGNPDLAGTTFAESGYFLNSFNDVGYAYVTLFELMVVNNWQVIVGGYVAATGTEATWLYFIAFNVIGALIIINIVVAFVLEAFVLQWELNESQAKSPLEDAIERYALNHHQYMSQFSEMEVDSGASGVLWNVKPNHNITYFLQHMFAEELAAEEAASEMFTLPVSMDANLAYVSHGS